MWSHSEASNSNKSSPCLWLKGKWEEIIQFCENWSMENAAETIEGGNHHPNDSPQTGRKQRWSTPNFLPKASKSQWKVSLAESHHKPRDNEATNVSQTDQPPHTE
jgi:hypothetical protein